MLQDDPQAASQDRFSDQRLDQWLIEQARHGSQIAADVLFHKYYDDIYRYLYLQWHFSIDEARDLSQEVFIKAWNGLSGLQQDSSFANWLRSIARHVACDALRSRKRRIQSSSFDPYLDVIDRNSSPEEQVLLTDLIERTLREMPEPRRTCLRLALSGFKPQAIAQELKLSEGTVKTYISLARKELRAAFIEPQTPSNGLYGGKKSCR